MSERSKGIGSWIRDLLTRGGSRRAADKASGLEDSASWQQIERTWDQAHRIVEGDLTALPTSKRGEKKFLEAFGRTRREIDALHEAGHLSPCEAQLLATHHEGLVESLEGRLSSGTSKLARPIIPARRSVHRLHRHVEMLQDLSDSEKLHPRAVERILRGLQGDVETLSNRAMLQQLALARRAEAGDLRNRVVDLIETIRQRLYGYGMTG